jgi:predicted ATPase with chaperone activity
VAADLARAGAEILAARAPLPLSIAETGLGRDFLADLAAKHLARGGALDAQQLSDRMALAWPVLEAVLDHLRAGACIEVRGRQEDSSLLRYGLTERGRALALDALMKCGYVGPAPVPVALYNRVVREQSVHRAGVTRAAMVRRFEDVVIRPELLDQLGPALHSGRPVFIYGPPGTGKTYIGQRLAGLLGGTVLVPHALAAADGVIRYFDPALHEPLPSATGRDLRLDEGHDPRFIACRRPAVVTGGELAPDMLELGYDAGQRHYRAPLQLKANNGLYLIDDLGRQKVSTAALLNRWIVPLEQRQDYLTLGSGERIGVPFDVVLVFSTNLDPLDLADEAFLRRLGYKIRFDALSRADYAAIWRQVCDSAGFPFDEAVLAHAFARYQAEGRPLLPCQPRDLLALALDRCRYDGTPPVLSPERLDQAWACYFIRPL